MSDDWEWDEAHLQVQQAPVSNQQTYFHNSRDSSSSNNWRSNGGGGGSNFHDRNRGPRRNDFGNGERAPRRNDFNSERGPRRFDNNQGDATTIKVPSRFVGRIIGKGGSKISDLQFESGARINVTKETEGDETLIRISGGQEETTKAEALIRELTVDRERNNTRFEQEPPPQEEAPAEKITDWHEFLKRCDELAQAEWDKLPPIKKQFYSEHPEVTRMSESEVAAFREASNNIVVERTFKSDDSKPIPKPVTTFEQAFHNYPEILEEIRKAGFTTPSPIQSQAWPVLLSGEDLIGIAQTGTGKTLAFLLPALIHIDGQVTTRAERKGPAVLVMAPTRELALQIDKEVKKYEYRGINAVCVYGGGNRREQIKVVTEGVDIVIATPGRMNDLVQAGYLNVQYVTYAVLDEADRMLDMGFEPQIRKVMCSIRPSRQTVMTSATWPLGVRRLAQSYMVDPIQVYVGTLDLAATHTVTQIIDILPDDDNAKLTHFLEFIENLNPDDKLIVFCGKKSRADDLSSELSLSGIGVQTIHGDRDQCDREQALIDIKDGTVQILIATDVASRGLDIDDITHVINYDFPRNIEEYVHRVGRTGRAGKTGKSISYVTRGDWGQCKDLINILEEAQQYVPEEIYQMAERHTAWKEKKDSERQSQGGGGGRRFGGRSKW